MMLYRCDVWSLTLREGRRLTVFENRVLRRIFGLRGDEVIREWRKYLLRSLMICNPHQTSFG
jgi:hypothetical protein